MKKGFSLIEIIVTIVIISIVMITIPKILQTVNNSLSFVQKQEAIYNAASLVGSVLKLSWDENNSKDAKSVHSLVIPIAGSPIQCNRTSSTRLGDFFNGSRACDYETDTNNSYIGASIANNSNINDMGDYDNTQQELNTSISSGEVKYIISTEVVFLKPIIGEPIATNNFWQINSANSVTLDLNKTTLCTGSCTQTNIKLLKTNVKYAPTYRNYGGKNITSFEYISPNIGLATIESL